ncbi:hypothetical protein BLS_008507 [Venturia inaequalis]|nr:hypothetical protein BLS_008507 [Venturia inaequalis]
MAVPAFSDVAKPANDRALLLLVAALLSSAMEEGHIERAPIINRDFYHATAAALDVKLKAPDGLAVNVKGVSPHDGDITGAFEARKVISKGTSNFDSLTHWSIVWCESADLGLGQEFGLSIPSTMAKIGRITVTETWTTKNLINTKLELEDTIAAGLKAEFLGAFSTKKGPQAQKLSLYFKQGAFNTRAFFNYNPTSGNVDATVDGVVAHEGFVVGGEAGYDVQKAALTRYSAALGYSTVQFSGAITATNNLSIFAASYYHKVNSSVEAGVKAAYDTKTSQTVSLEIASKYKIDPATFAKAKISDRGILSLAYNTKINQGFTFGIGASLDTQKLNEASHKIGTSFTFEG